MQATGSNPDIHKLDLLDQGLVVAVPETSVIDTISIDATHSVVVRAESGGDRSFLELREGDAVKWQALIPHYIGDHARPAPRPRHRSAL